MVQLQRFLNPQSSDHNPLPLLNTLIVNQSSLWLSTGEEHGFKTFMRWARKSPHLMGFLNIIATDILSDEILWESSEKNASGRNRIKKAKEFWRVNKGTELVEATIYDFLICGVGYNWVGAVNEQEVREVFEKVRQENPIEYRADEIYELARNGMLSILARKLRHIPATTVSIKTTQYGVEQYVQTVNATIKTFTPEEVIKFSLMPLDGKPYPYSPMEGLLSEVYLLWLISQNYVSYFENGGAPDKAFILPKEIANSKNHSYLIEVLKKYKKIQNKHGNLVFTGDLKIEELQNAESQMAHKDLGLYLVGILAMMYGVPVSRIPFLIGKAANNGDAGGLADSGYWRKISVWQSKFEDGYNAALWNRYFGVDMMFRRGYLQDEVRETTNLLNKNNIAEQRINMGLWTVAAAGQYLGIEEEEVNAAQAEKKTRQDEELKSGMLLQNTPKSSPTIHEPDKNAADDRRRSAQNRNQQDAGQKVR